MPSLKQTLAYGALVVLTVTMAGCSPDRLQPAAITPSASAPATSTPTSPVDDVEQPPVLPAIPAEDEGLAIAAAEDIMRLFARPDLDANDWINELYPHLTEAAGFAYEGTDPANVPCRTVTGPGVVTGEPTEYAVIVQVPTDAGLYNVSLTRTGEGAAWLADRIRPAEA